ncbi:MAG TPA: CsbD family protein [Dyella sp.]|uniref:CsbD family protein n=1 Tax=Dyella sp. TaxID=1869338 RepID=UPI002D79A4B5|nr:CsbD family protein [Dyella sp.]HET6553656.1 CsbD family protein [Dyella sp.]
MNQDTIQGNWKQLSGKIKQQWGKLTDDDLKVAEGNAEYLSGRLQERYGMARDEAEREVKAFEKELRHH